MLYEDANMREIPMITKSKYYFTVQNKHLLNIKHIFVLYDKNTK